MGISNKIFTSNIVSKEYCQIIVSTEADPYLSDNIEQLAQIVEEINSMPLVKVVEFVGSKEYFSAGGSKEFLNTMDSAHTQESVAQFPKILLKIKAITIANMFGHAIGGGFAFGLWSDLPCLSEASLYGAKFMSLGFTPGMGSTIVLEDYFGKPLAHEMILTGSLYKGKQLKKLACPIANRIFSKDSHEREVNNLINTILEINLKPLLLLKQTLAERRLKGLNDVLAQEINMHRICFTDKTILKNIDSNYE